MDIQAILDASDETSSNSSAAVLSVAGDLVAGRGDNMHSNGNGNMNENGNGIVIGHGRYPHSVSSYAPKPARTSKTTQSTQNYTSTTKNVVVAFGDETSNNDEDDDDDDDILHQRNHHHHHHHQHHPDGIDSLTEEEEISPTKVQGEIKCGANDYANAYAKALTTNVDYHNHQIYYSNKNNNNHNHSNSALMGSVDLEQILREDDDDDEDDELLDGSGHDDEDEDPNDVLLPHRRRQTAWHQQQQQQPSSTESLAASSSFSSSHACVTSVAGEDWDVLQAILGEEDEEDDDDDDGDVIGIGDFSRYGRAGGGEDDEAMMNGSDGGGNYKNGSAAGYYDYNRDWKTVSLPLASSDLAVSSSTTNNNNSHHQLDSILQQSDEEAELALDRGNIFISGPLSPTRSTKPTTDSNNNSNWTGVVNEVNNGHNGAAASTATSLAGLETTQTDSFATAAQSEASNSSSTMDQPTSTTLTAIVLTNAALGQQTASNTEGKKNNPAATKSLSKKAAAAGSTAAASDWDLEKASRMALQYAQAYERKLLKSGHRDIVSPLMVKRRLKQKIELNTKQQQKQRLKLNEEAAASTQAVNRLFANTPKKVSNIHNTSLRFAFSGAVETKQMESVSVTLLKNMPDLPTALAINSRFIAIGTQRGEILVFDLFETFRKRLRHGGDTPFDIKTAGSVTTIDLSLIQGDILAAGYTSGFIVLWDALRGVALRTVIESQNPSPITNVRFLNELKLVTVDAGGLVNKLTFSKNMLWNSYSVESDCLLDGTAGQILAMNVLDPYPAVHQQLPLATPAMKKIVLLALSSERSSFAVAAEPSVHVLHRWAKPTEEQMAPGADEYGGTTSRRNIGATTTSKSGSRSSRSSSEQVYLPCLAWGWALVSGGGNVATPILARAWGCSIQLLRASFPEEDPNAPPEVFQWPAFGVQDEFQSSAPVVALDWLNDRSLLYLTVTNEFTVVDTVMMTLLERLDFSGLRLVYAEFSLSRKAETSEVNNFCTTFQNSVRSRDNRLLLLCQEELKSVAIVGAKRRISALEQDGEWLEALASALDHYENTVSSQQDRRRDPLGRKDLSRHPEYASNARSEDEEWIAKLLIRYINIAVENAPELSEFELAQSHFQMLAGVCVEFCVVTKRLDVLFGPTFRRFHSAGFASVFLDVLEPYILNDKLDYIAPEAMAHFVEHCRTTNGIATVERCLLHMDVTIMDFDSILSLLRANEMYSALFYVFNQGLNDFTTPLEILAEKIFDAADTTNQNSANGRRKDGVPRNELERYGYKAILYLQYCFRNRTFPQDTEIEDEERRAIIRCQLLRFLLQKRFAPSPSVRKPAKVVGQRTQVYPYTHILLMVDPKAMLDSLSLAMDAPDSKFGRDTSFESIQGWEVEVGAERASDHGREPRTTAPDRQEIIGMLLSIIMPESDDSSANSKAQLSTLHRSQHAINALLDFLAEYLMKGVVRANKTVTFMILNRMAARFESATDPQDRLQSQKQIMQLLTALPRTSYEPEEVLVLVQKSGIHRAALLLHQEGASSWGRSESHQELEHRAAHFRAAIDCYLDDDDPEFRREVFAYVKKECSGAASEDDPDDEPGPNALRDALTSKLSDLVQLDSLLTAELVAELFVDNLDRVIEQLDDENAQFLFFQAIISGDLDAKDQVAGAVLNANLTMEHHHKYLALMAKLHPDDVYDYLQNHDNYRPEACLPLCQKYDIADASCYLLERMGNVSSGLQLILQTLESRMMGLKRTIRGMGTESYNKYSAPRHPAIPWKKRSDYRPNHHVEAFDITEREIAGVKRVLVVALDLCERNSGTFSSRTEHGSQLWFNVLDRLINAKGFLRLSKEQPGHAKVTAGVLSELLRLTMQRMVSSVPLPDLVRKVTSDHSGSRLGELREMVESLLSTYGFELNVFSGAVSVFHHDLGQMQKQHRDLRIQGGNVRKILNVPLSDSDNDNQNMLAQKVLLVESVLEGDVLQLGEGGNAILVNADGAAKISSGAIRPNGEQGLGNALSKLRSRRRATTASSRADLAATHPHTLNFMTDREKLYRQGELDPDATYFEDRMRGLLGDAEHRGRLMSFTY